MTLELSGNPNTSYVIEESIDLRIWAPVSTTNTDSTGTLSVPVRSLSGQQHFYRATAQQ